MGPLDQSNFFQIFPGSVVKSPMLRPSCWRLPAWSTALVERDGLVPATTSGFYTWLWKHYHALPIYAYHLVPACYIIWIMCCCVLNQQTLEADTFEHSMCRLLESFVWGWSDWEWTDSGALDSHGKNKGVTYNNCPDSSSQSEYVTYIYTIIYIICVHSFISFIHNIS